MLWVLAEAAAAPLSSCEHTYATVDLTTSIDRAELAFTNLDSAALAEARGEAQRRLACITERVDPLVLARVHRMEALSAFVVGEQGKVAQALAGALVAEPGHEIPTNLVPEEHAIREQRRIASQLLREGEARPLVGMATGGFVVDGDTKHTLSTSHAGIVQQLDENGAVVETRYVWPTDDLGAWAGTTAPNEGPAWTRTRHAIPYLGLTGGFFGASAPVRGRSPGAFGGGAPAADLGLVVPVGPALGVALSAGFGLLPETKGGISARVGRLHGGLHLAIGRGGVELGPTVIVSDLEATNYSAKGFAGGLGLAGHMRLLRAGPVGFGLRTDISGLTSGGMFIAWMDVGLNVTWEGADG